MKKTISAKNIYTAGKILNNQMLTIQDGVIIAIHETSKDTSFDFENASIIRLISSGSDSCIVVITFYLRKNFTTIFFNSKIIVIYSPDLRGKFSFQTLSEDLDFRIYRVQSLTTKFGTASKSFKYLLQH